MMKLVRRHEEGRERQQGRTLSSLNRKSAHSRKLSANDPNDIINTIAQSTSRMKKNDDKLLHDPYNVLSTRE